MDARQRAGIELMTMVGIATPVAFPTAPLFVKPFICRKQTTAARWLSRMEFASLRNMQLAASDVRRRARYHLIRGGTPGMAQGMTVTKRYLVLLFQAATIALLGMRGFPTERLVFHGLVGVLYGLACFCPGPPITERRKVRMLAAGLLAWGAWLVNTGGLSSPLLPLGFGMLPPALVILDTSRQRRLFAAGALTLLLGVAGLSWWHVPASLPPLAPRGGHVAPEYLILVAGSLVVTAVNVAGFWGHMTAAYEKVALELGVRREELCSFGEDATRQLEGAAAHLAHEMKNPLASIKCLSAHLARGCSLDGRTVERLEVVAAEADRLESIVDGFLSMSRGLGELRPEPVRPKDLVDELRLLIEARAAEAGVTLEVTGRADLEILADSRKLHRALFYLTMNAVQASAAGQTVTIDVGAPSAAGGSKIRVIDRGEGMTSETLERLKRPPFARRKGGSGLGVAVARALIEQHGGRLVYESAPGLGTTATIELPLAAVVAAGGLRLLPDTLRPLA
jgi:signal transduction histidine kinase